MSDGIYRITTACLFAGLIVRKGRVTYTSHRLGWSRGKDPREVREWVRRRRGSMEKVKAWIR